MEEHQLLRGIISEGSTGPDTVPLNICSGLKIVALAYRVTVPENLDAPQAPPQTLPPSPAQPHPGLWLAKFGRLFQEGEFLVSTSSEESTHFTVSSLGQGHDCVECETRREGRRWGEGTGEGVGSLVSLQWSRFKRERGKKEEETDGERLYGG